MAAERLGFLAVERPAVSAGQGFINLVLRNCSRNGGNVCRMERPAVGRDKGARTAAIVLLVVEKELGDNAKDAS
jgi:hypothetical protein